MKKWDNPRASISSRRQPPSLCMLTHKHTHTTHMLTHTHIHSDTHTQTHAIDSYPRGRTELLVKWYGLYFIFFTVSFVFGLRAWERSGVILGLFVRPAS